MVLPLIVPVPATPVVPALDLTTETTTQATASQGTRPPTVRDGETIYDIAARYRVSPGALLSRNHLSSGDFIHPGQRLTVPARSGGSSPSSAKPARSGATRTYVVRSGDTLTGVAARHHMSVERLRSLNGLDGGFIHPGDTLRVTGTAVKPAKRATTAAPPRRTPSAPARPSPASPPVTTCR